MLDDNFYKTPFWVNLNSDLKAEYFKAEYFYYGWLRKLGKKDYGRLKNTDEYIEKRATKALHRFNLAFNAIANKKAP